SPWTTTDHILAWADGGTTGISNLGQPCPKHHKLRHTTGWKPTQATKNEPPGWTSPTGRHYPSEHQDWEPTHWPALRYPDQVQGEGAPDALPDLVHLGISPVENWLERILHAPTA
ncbi:MAG TPA: HNH endonuclease signature motif containing protein, partial [Arthrobacter sp.]